MTWSVKSMTLRQEIILALALKAALLAAIWGACFSGAQDKPIDAQQAATYVLSPHSTKEPNHDADQRAR